MSKRSEHIMVPDRKEKPKGKERDSKKDQRKEGK